MVYLLCITVMPMESWSADGLGSGQESKADVSAVGRQKRESAADSIISRYTSGISQHSARAELLMSPCIISLISARQVRACQPLIVRKVWQRHRYGLMWMR